MKNDSNLQFLGGLRVYYSTNKGGEKLQGSVHRMSNILRNTAQINT